MEEELRIRVSKKLKEKIEQKAKELNISVSAYVRMKLSE
jgi:antitoxin component of RelBE/YafQ-DinJ toxin-antitoxin module